MLATVLGTQTLQADSTPPPPESVILLATPSLGKVTLAWLPPADGPADEYKVYGYQGTSKTELIATQVTTATVSSGYDRYAVTALRGLAESPEESVGGCILLELGSIPPLRIDCT